MVQGNGLWSGFWSGHLSCKKFNIKCGPGGPSGPGGLFPEFWRLLFFMQNGYVEVPNKP